MAHHSSAYLHSRFSSTTPFRFQQIQARVTVVQRATLTPILRRLVFLDKVRRSEKESRRRMGILYAWLLNCFLLISVIGLVAFQLIMLMDLEFDYMNPYDTASRMNLVTLPEYFAHGLLCIAFLFTGHWFFFLLSLPYLYNNIRMYLQRRHLVDVTEIYNQLSTEKQQRLFKLGYLVILLVLCIFWFLWTIEGFE